MSRKRTHNYNQAKETSKEEEKKVPDLDYIPRIGKDMRPLYNCWIRIQNINNNEVLVQVDCQVLGAPAHSITHRYFPLEGDILTDPEGFLRKRIGEELLIDPNFREKIEISGIQKLPT